MKQGFYHLGKQAPWEAWPQRYPGALVHSLTWNWGLGLALEAWWPWGGLSLSLRVSPPAPQPLGLLSAQPPPLAQVVMKVVQLLPDGHRVKKEVDAALDIVSETMTPMHYHLREIIICTHRQVSPP